MGTPMHGQFMLRHHGTATGHGYGYGHGAWQGNGIAVQQLSNESDFRNSSSPQAFLPRERRMPSPISEGAPSPNWLADGMGEMQMDVDSPGGTPPTHSHSNYQSPSQPPNPDYGAGQGQHRPPTSSPTHACPPYATSQTHNHNTQHLYSQPLTQSPSPKKGHNRSRFSLRNWNAGDGEAGAAEAEADVRVATAKRGFSMGYRSDCDKCRMKVPGHFSHIVGC